MNREEFLETCSLIVCFLEGYTTSQDAREKRQGDDEELAVKIRELLKNVKPYFNEVDSRIKAKEESPCTN